MTNMQFTLLTPPGSGAIAVYLLSGLEAPAILKQCCALSTARIRAGELRRIRIKDGDHTLDDALLLTRQSPYL